MAAQARLQTVEIPVAGMDCAECTRHVQHAIAALPGVESVQVFLAAEKAVVRLDRAKVDLPAISQAVAAAGYQVPAAKASAEHLANDTARAVLTAFGVVFGLVLFIIVAGEWLGLFEQITARVPWYAGLGIVLLAGYPVFRNVARAALKGQVISHTLMSVGVLAALVVGEWATAVVVVFFMRVGDAAERFTTERARRAVKDLTALAPQMARVERGGQEVEIAAAQVSIGETVIVRPGEKIPVDGQVLAGQATVDQSSLTGESMPVEAGPGSGIYAASLVRLGSLRVRAERVGPDTTFGRVIHLVEEAESHRADVQRVADRFSAIYLPVVAAIAALTLVIRRDPLATAAVLVVACSCSFALATPIAILASVGAGARRGLLIKGGKYLETLARADVLLVDKTGTLTLGQPRLAEIQALDGRTEAELLVLAASAERYSEHPLAKAVRKAARERGLELQETEEFHSLPGQGVQARLAEQWVAVGSPEWVISTAGGPGLPTAGHEAALGQAKALQAQGKTVLCLAIEGKPAGLLGLTDAVRPEVPAALAAVRALGIHQVELLTGDNPSAAAALAAQLGIPYRAGLLPEEKIAAVKAYQAKGHVVVMVGDGVNDAPALAQADVGIAMGAAGSDIAIEAAHIALLRDDWMLVPAALRIARRTLRVVKMNIAFTAVYNLVGLSLAAFGLLPPIFAAAAQSLPDLGILANSARLLRQQE